MPAPAVGKVYLGSHSLITHKLTAISRPDSFLCWPSDLASDRFCHFQTRQEFIFSPQA